MKKILLILFIFSIFLKGNDYKEWLNNQYREYNSYKKSLDEEFSNMLKKDWESFKTTYNIKSYEKPKPKKLPKTKEIELNPIIIKKSKPITIEKPKPIIIKPKIKPIRVNLPTFKSIRFNFYGEIVNIDYDKKTKINLYSYTKSSIANYWEEMSRTNYKKLIKQINNYRDNLSLNDWGVYKLINKIGYNIYYNKSMANLFSWFIFTKMGYDMRVGYSNNNIYLLGASSSKMYQVSFFRLNGKRYYVLSPKGRVKSIGAVATYRGDYPNANRLFSLDIDRAINLNRDIAYRSLDFDYNGKMYHINAKYSKDLVEFFKTYPQGDYKIYFDAKKSIYLQSMIREIEPKIRGLTEVEAVNFLLRLTQKSFEYKRDPEQFGYEKVLFPEETLYYPNSDCEDRAIFFSYLIKHLTPLKIVGIKYSNHLATAVAFSTPIQGDSFHYNGRRYTITDPTYINANVGMTMPQYRGATFKVIEQKVR